MIRRRVSAVLRLRDGFTGRVLPGGAVCLLDGRPLRHPLWKEGGYLVIQDLAAGPHSLEVLDASRLPQLELDASYLRQALLNLVKNSESAMEKGGRLDIEVFSDGDFVRIAVRDTGCGIDQEHLAKIFEPYFTTKASGTGLGLTVAYKIVKEHGGDMGVESTVGQGTCFTISLPVPSDERTALEESNG